MGFLFASQNKNLAGKCHRLAAWQEGCRDMWVRMGDGMANGEHKELLYKDEVFAIIGTAFEVYNTLGSGFLEAVYQEALAREMEIRNIPFQEQVPVIIPYKGKPLKTPYYADFLYYSRILVEIKALECLIAAHESQLLHYMRGTKLQVGVLINFGNMKKLEWKRFVI